MTFGKRQPGTVRAGERRGGERRGSQHSVRIVADSGQVTECTVLNISPTGARCRAS